MRHEQALRKLDQLDRGELPGPLLRLHLATCPSCAKAQRLVSKALDSYAQAADKASPVSERIEGRIMAAVRLTPEPRQDFAIFDWIAPAAILFLSICFVPVASGLGLFSSFITGFSGDLVLALAVIFTVYSVFFVGSHLAELQAFLEKRGMIIR